MRNEGSETQNIEVNGVVFEREGLGKWRKLDAWQGLYLRRQMQLPIDGGWYPWEPSSSKWTNKKVILYKGKNRRWNKTLASSFSSFALSGFGAPSKSHAKTAVKANEDGPNWFRRRPFIHKLLTHNSNEKEESVRIELILVAWQVEL